MTDSHPSTAIFGPAATKWYQFLARNINLRSTNTTIAARVACDQLLFGPTNMAVFLSSMAFLEGASPKERLKQNYVTGMVSNFMVWPWVQAVNFKFVPLDLRVLVVNVVSLGKCGSGSRRQYIYIYIYACVYMYRN